MDAIPDYSRFTLEQVEQWAGPDLAFRARSYVRRVDDLRLAPDGELVGWVEGSARYATKVWPDAGGALQSSCTCGSPRQTCKHAVGVLLSALFRLRDGTALPAATGDDIRLGNGDLSFLPIEQVEGGRHGLNGAFPERLVKRLSALTKGELVDLLASLAGDNHEVATLIAIRLDPEGRNPADQVAWVRDSIHAASEHPGWKDPRSGEQFTPDYGPVERGLTALVEKCGAAHVVTLGAELCTLANQQLAETEDDGETRAGIIECLAVVLAALEMSPLTPVERVCWYWDRLLDDPYHLFQALAQPDVIEALEPGAWRQVASAYRQRLAELPGHQPDEDWRTRQQRSGLLDYVTRALRQAGDTDAIAPMLVAQLPHSANYQLLVDHLSTSGANDDAERWALQGFKTLQLSAPAEAWRLVDQLSELRARRGNAAAAAALRVEQFLCHPSSEALRVVTQLTPERDHERVHAALTRWLARGDKPQQTSNWPLPPSGLTVKVASARSSFPHYSLLIDLALDAGRHEEAVSWHRQAPPHANQAQRIADAVQESHPDISLGIWSQRVDALVQEARPADYVRAKPYLEGIRDLYFKAGSRADADAWFQKLRRRHKAKRRLLQVMDEVQYGQQAL